MSPASIVGFCSVDTRGLCPVIGAVGLVAGASVSAPTEVPGSRIPRQLNSQTSEEWPFLMDHEDQNFDFLPQQSRE